MYYLFTNIYTYISEYDIKSQYMVIVKYINFKTYKWSPLAVRKIQKFY